MAHGAPTGTGKGGDLLPTAFPQNLSWKDGDRNKSLGEVIDSVSGVADKGIGWYKRKKPSKRRYGRLLLVGAIIATTCAGLIPILDDIFGTEYDVQEVATEAKTKPAVPADPKTKPVPPADPKTKPAPSTKPKVKIVEIRTSKIFDPLWAAVAIAIAAMLIALDRFWGFSSAWVRYMLAEMSLTHALASFRLKCERARAAWSTDEPSQDETLKMIEQCGTFLNDIQVIMRDETEAWAADFQKAIKQIEEATKKTRADLETERTKRAEKMKAREKAQKEPGGINVKIANADKVTGEWQLKLDDDDKGEWSGNRAAVIGIAPGLHSVRVSGTIDSKPVHDAMNVKVAAGEIADAELNLQ